MPQQGLIIYYLGRGTNTTIEPFPPDVAGKKAIDAGRSYYQNDMTVAKCLALCSSFAVPYIYAGLASGHGDQCFCGNELNTVPTDATNPCTAHCSGSRTE